MALLIALLLRPFAQLLLYGVVLLGARHLIIRYWPDGRVKRLLLFDLRTRKQIERARSRPRR